MALFDRPLGRVRVRIIVGVGEPSVGRLERLGYRFTPTDPAAPPIDAADPVVQAMAELGIARCTDQNAAAAQWKRDSDAARAPNRDLPVGTAPTVSWSSEPREVAYTFTVELPATTPAPPGGTVPDTLVDLVQRVLPRVVAEAVEPICCLGGRRLQHISVSPASHPYPTGFGLRHDAGRFASLR